MSYYSDERVTLHHGDCLDVLRTLPDNSVDAVVTDPPYGLEFMGREWDSFKPTKESKRCATQTDSAQTRVETGATSAANAPSGGASVAPGATESGARQSDPARAASATIVQPDAVGGFQDGNGGNAYSRSRVRTNTQRHGGDPLTANRGFQNWCELWTAECLRVLKPGGHLLAFGGTRTWHRLACAVEDAGFEVRDSIAWLYGSGFPKSLDVSKAIDKRRDWSLVERLSGEIRRARAEAGLSLAEIGKATQDATDGTYGKWYHRGGHMFFETGRSLPSRPEWEHLRHVLPIAPEFVEVYDEAEREVLSERKTSREDAGWAREAGSGMFQPGERTIRDTAPATPDAERWQGWGTALKPAFEPVVVARKPLQGTVAANVLTWGTGALNVDGCRVEGEPDPHHVKTTGQGNNRRASSGLPGGTGVVAPPHPAGRWPANVVLDESQAAALDEMSGESDSRRIEKPADPTPNQRITYNGANDGSMGGARPARGHTDSGGASRFFYVAKADASERPRVNGTAHPTVKPLALMRWLVRLVTPPGGTVLEPFAGSGTTVEACIVEGFRCIAIEREAEYLPLITQRIHRRRDPVAYIKAAGDDLGLFELDGEGA